MEIDMEGLEHIATKYEIKRAIADVLHGDYFHSDPDARLCNFEVTLNEGLTTARNDGTGKLVLPNRKIGQRFLKWVKENGIRVQNRRIRFYQNGNRPYGGLVQMLSKALYLGPELDEERDRIMQELDRDLRVNQIQFGTYFHPPCAPRAYSREWEGDYRYNSFALLRVEYDHKVIRIKLGDPMTEQICHRVIIKFSSIRKIAIGVDFGNPFICFDLMIPPVLEQEYFNRELTGDANQDGRNFRKRIGYLDPAHQRVAPYAHHVRITLARNEDLGIFQRLCRSAGLRPPIIANVDASRAEFYTMKELNRVYVWLQTLDWTVAFQIEALLHNGLLNSRDLLEDLYHPICELYKEKGPPAGHYLRLFSEALQTRLGGETPRACFARICSGGRHVSPPPLASGHFLCRHVSFTPTRIILEGPYVVQSNRVIRRFQGFEEYFIRVDFRDEDRLQYRWDREVDAAFFLKERVGEVLKRGFTLGCRHFEFLAYSSSALREHSVWFIHPFHHPREGYVTGASIRETLGDFSGVIKCPSKYAARMAQAFTATDPSVRIRRDEWCEIPDLGQKPYEFTDGVGTISRELADQIWDKLCIDRKTFDVNAIVRPTAFQIRFLGYKGMVAIDDQLKGKMMCLRPSMNKFKAHEEDNAEIEIARAFDRPMRAYLNRSLIMVLEDRGVRADTFIKLQERAVADVMMARDSIAQFRGLLEAHGLGKAYSLSSVLEGLNDLGFDFKAEKEAEKNKQILSSPFLRRIMHFSTNHVLRDIKHGARIPMPNSWLLPGIADEGPAYQAAGHSNVFTLPEGHIYACIQNKGDEEPTWLKGLCIIWRSPVVHPGDVCQVMAVGKPPDNQLCLFRNLVNVVVLPSVGTRSLASGLGGGDVDGDTFYISRDPSLLPTEHFGPAAYTPVDPFTIEQDSTIENVCDFVVEYIHSDVLGLLSNRHLIIADQSKDGTKDPDCLRLAELCSRAVDYPKNGVPVDIRDSPRFLIKYKPDWQAAEVTAPRKMDYYESDRAIGQLYRRIVLRDPVEPSPDPSPNDSNVSTVATKQVNDPITVTLTPIVQYQLRSNCDLDGEQVLQEEITQSFIKYRDEMRYICITHTLSNDPEVRLTEEEVVITTILAKCSQGRWRKDRMHRMLVHATTLVHEIQRELLTVSERDTPEGLQRGLHRAWTAWNYSVQNSNEYSSSSFGLIALRVIFDALDRLDNSWRTDRSKRKFGGRFDKLGDDSQENRSDEPSNKSGHNGRGKRNGGKASRGRR